MLGAIVWLVLGGSVGWLASLITRCGTQHGIVFNILAGILGALAGRLFLKKLMDESVMFTSMIASLAGAIIVTGIVNLVWRRALS